MREPLEMVTASRMQNMMEIYKKNICFVTIFFQFWKTVLLGLSALRAPTVGPFGIVENDVQTVVKNVVQVITERLTRLATILYIAPLAKNQVALLVAKLTMVQEFSKQVLGNSGSATTNLVKHNTG